MFHDCRVSPRTRAGHTQNLEEQYILAHARGSRFLDIGAYDGEKFSSTLGLVEKEWSGVYVEPDPLVLPRLRQVAERSCSEVLPVAIGSVCDTLPFHMNGEMVSSLDKRHTDLWATNNGMVFETILVPVIDVETLADRVGRDFDVLNLDVEGLNWEVFQQFKWDEWNFNVVCIEYDRHFNEMKHSLEQAGFKVVYASPENIVAVKE